MKKCYTCKSILDETQFNKNKSRADGLNSICRECSKERSRKYYQENRESHIKTIGKRKKLIIGQVKEKILDYLSTHPCVDCGNDDILVLEFDHQHSKINDVSSMVRGGNSWSTVKKEISKCEVRCANCHRRRTHLAANDYRAKFVKK